MECRSCGRGQRGPGWFRSGPPRWIRNEFLGPDDTSSITKLSPDANVTFRPSWFVCDLSFTMFLKWSGGMAVRRRCPLLALCRDPRACPPVVVWLDAPCPPPEAPDTAPEFSDCLERGVDDHNSVNNDDWYIGVVIRK
jgi:hypothetical protein